MEHVVEQRVGSRRRTWHDDLPVAAAAAGAASCAWVVAWLAGVDLEVRSGGGIQHVSVVSVLVTAVVVTLVAGGLLRRLERRTATAMRTWTLLATAVLVVSLAAPLGADTAAGGLVLAGLHLLVGGVVIAGLRRSRLGRRVA